MALGPFGPPDPPFRAGPTWASPMAGPFIPGPYPQPPPEPYIDTPKEPDKEFQKEAQEFFGNFGKESSAYIEAKLSQNELYKRLTRGEVSIRQWAVWPDTLSQLELTQSRRPRTIELPADVEDDITDYVLPIAPYINAFAQYGYLRIFNGPEYLAVVSEDLAGGPTAPERFSASYKLQQLLLSLLAQGRVHSKMFLALHNMATFGLSCVKISWYNHTIQKWRWNLLTFKQEQYEDSIYDCPIVQPIPLNRWLPDKNATTTDIQMWRAIGHWVERPYAEVISSFDRGSYTMNRDEFEKRYKSGGTSRDDSSGLDHDPDSDSVEDTVPKVRIWEIHGRVPSKRYGLIECCWTCATSPGVKSPLEGTPIRLTMQPILACGLRPFALAHYNERDEPFGGGMIEENRDNIYLLSQFIGQIQDIARRQGSTARIYDPSDTELVRYLKDHGQRVPLGAFVPSMMPEKIKPLESGNSETAAINTAIQMLMNVFQRQTMTDTFLGLQSADDTATGANIRQIQSQTPAQARTDLFARNILEPVGNLALAMMQQFILEDRTVVVRDDNGEDVPIVVTPEDLQRGKYKVRAVLTNQDSSRIATAQGIMAFLQNIPPLMPYLQAQAWDVSLGELVKHWAEAQIPGGGTDRIVTRLPAPIIPPPMGAERPSGQGGTAPAPDKLVENGGPMGPEPSDDNAQAQQLQLDALRTQGGYPPR